MDGKAAASESPKPPHSAGILRTGYRIGTFGHHVSMASFENPFAGPRLAARRRIAGLCGERPLTRKELATALARPEGALTSALRGAVEAGALEADDPELRAGTTYSLNERQRAWLDEAAAEALEPGRLRAGQTLVLVVARRPHEALALVAAEGLAGVLAWAARLGAEGHLLLAFADVEAVVLDRLAARLEAADAEVRRFGVGELLTPERLRRAAAAVAAARAPGR